MKLKKALLSFSCILLVCSAVAQPNSGSISSSTMTACDTIVASISGFYCCGNSSLTGNSHSINNGVITINVTSTCPQICLPSLVQWSTTYDLFGVPAGTYSVIYAYNSVTNSQLSSSLTVSNSVTAIAGNDTSLCGSSTFQLNGNNPPTGLSGTWVVLSGNGSLNNSALPNATVSNLSAGMNELEWTINDSICPNSDVIKIFMDEIPSSAITELNRFACYDSTTIKASPAASGTGKWTVLTPGVSLPIKTTASSLAFNLQLGPNVFEWAIDGGICGVNRDTLVIEHQEITAAPVISQNGNVLTSTPAPAYQWYENGIKIPFATNQTYQVTVNGKYRVLASYPGCENGLLSNEINIVGVGVEKSDQQNIKLYPNPVREKLQVSIGSARAYVVYALFNDLGQLVFQREEKNVQQSTLDLSFLPKGVYFLTIETADFFHGEKLLIR